MMPEFRYRFVPGNAALNGLSYVPFLIYETMKKPPMVLFHLTETTGSPLKTYLKLPSGKLFYLYRFLSAIHSHEKNSYPPG